MFRRFSRIFFAVVLILAFVGILGLFTTADNASLYKVLDVILRVEHIYNGERCPGSTWDAKYASNLGFWDILNRSFADQHMPRPWIGSYQCKDAICSEFLYERDWVRVGKCVNMVKKRAELINKVRPTLRPACHFMNGTSRGGVALLSFPGSGNTWLRGLLEKATGICTGEGMLSFTETKRIHQMCARDHLLGYAYYAVNHRLLLSASNFCFHYVEQ